MNIISKVRSGIFIVIIDLDKQKFEAKYFLTYQQATYVLGVIETHKFLNSPR